MTPTEEDLGRREHDRVRLALQVAYRSTGSFLVSYSVDLSQGGLFLETKSPREVGTELDLWVAIPGAEEDVRLKGTVVWTRRDAMPGLPAGMGIQFHGVEESCGSLIDLLVRHFSGLRVLVASPSERVRAQLVRQLRTALAATLVERELRVPLMDSDEEPFDLVALDLGEGDEIGLAAVADLAGRASAVAVVAMSSHPRARQLALDRGAHEVIGSPPSLSELRGAAIRALGRPQVMGSDSMEADRR